MKKETFLKFESEKENVGSRLDKFLYEKVIKIKNVKIFSRSRIQSLIKEGNVKVDDKIILNPAFKIKQSNNFIVYIPRSIEGSPKGQNIPLEILFEDEDIIVINKPFGMVVHPGAGNKENTLVNALLSHCGNSLSGIGGVIRPGIVHRIDKDTSGIIVSAKNDFSHIHLSNQFKIHSIERSYFALVWGVPLNKKGIINKPIARDPNNRIKMAVSYKGKHAITKWKVLKNINNIATLIRCDLETGRTHQIRVHLASIGSEIIGDKVYKSKKRFINSISKNNVNLLKDFHRQALHAFKLVFFHPTKNQFLNFEIPIANDIQKLIDKLEKL